MASSYLFIALMASCVWGSISQEFSIPVVPCRGEQTTGTVEQVRLTGCQRFPCLLKKGTQVTISIDYRTGSSTNTVTNGAFGILGRTPLPFLGVHGTPACSSIQSRSAQGTSCPQSAGQSYTYTNSFPIHRIYPSTNVNVQWELRDDANQKILCIMIPAKIA